MTFYNTFFVAEKTAAWWAALAVTAVLGGAACLVAYFWLSAPKRALKRLGAGKACATALKCADAKKPLRVIAPPEPAGSLPPKALRHFVSTGERLTAGNAAEVAKEHHLETRPNDKSFLKVRYSLVFAWPRMGPGFLRVETDSGTRIVSAGELIFAVAFDAASADVDRAPSPQSPACGDDWRARLQGRRRAVFDLEGNLAPEEFVADADLCLLQN